MLRQQAPIACASLLWLVRMGSPKNRRFAQVRSNQLETDRQGGIVKPARHADGAQSGQVHGDREHIAQIHLQRVVRLLADAKGGSRCHRRSDHVHLGECALKSCLISVRTCCALR